MRQKTIKSFHFKGQLQRWILIWLFAVLMFSACSAKALPAGFDEAKVNDQAKLIVTQLSNGDYGAVEAQFTDLMKTALPAGALKTALDPLISKLGPFKDFQAISTGSGENPQAGKYVVVVIRAAYTNGEGTYTISIDEAGKLTGLYLK